MVPQETHSWKCMQASVGMVCSLFAPQAGQASTELRTTADDSVMTGAELGQPAERKRVIGSMMNAGAEPLPSLRMRLHKVHHGLLCGNPQSLGLLVAIE